MRYQDVYPSSPAVDSREVTRRSAAELLTLEYFEAEPGSMPEEVFDEHHVLLNLKEEPHRVENWRDGDHRDFVYRKFEVVVTPAGLKSGWRWHERSKVIVVTLEPDLLEVFAKNQLGILLSRRQLLDTPQFEDQELVRMGESLLDALRSDFGSAVMFESLARVFLVKLLERYSDRSQDESAFSESFAPRHYRKVLDFVAKHYDSRVAVEDLAKVAGLSPFHFSRLFKRAIGETPHQFLMAYRVERAKELLADKERPMVEIALSCGFSDQAHFSRSFKQSTGKSPRAWRV
ncbi:MAG: helix-turn-helix domain-containing protein [Verrucomicrobiota bacterium]